MTIRFGCDIISANTPPGYITKIIDESKTKQIRSEASGVFKSLIDIGKRVERGELPVGECIYFDEAYERLTKLQELELAEIDVNMFKAINNQLINDGCGLFRGRQILPFEHVSRFQNDLID